MLAAKAWPNSAKMRECWSILAKCWPTSAKHWPSTQPILVEFRPNLGSRSKCLTIVGQLVGHCLATSELAGIAKGNFKGREQLFHNYRAGNFMIFAITGRYKAADITTPKAPWPTSSMFPCSHVMLVYVASVFARTTNATQA